VPAPPAPPAPLPPAPPPPATNTPWNIIGPFNIGDDASGGGEGGTIAPAVSSIANPNVMYMGGNNNAAASGVLKSVDYGKHWSKVNVGLWDTRILGLFMIDEGDHLLAGTPSGVFETLNGGGQWVHVKVTQGWGVAASFRNGTIGGKSYLLVGQNAGLANVPLSGTPLTPLANGTWNLIKSPPGHAAWRTNAVSVAEYRKGKPLLNSVVAGCIWPPNSGGVVHIATIINETAADWMYQLNKPCQSIAIDPNDADHLIVNNASNGAHVYESHDGGQTYQTCLNQRGMVMVAIDRQGWYYAAAEAGAFRNRGGCVNGTWEPLFVRRVWRRTGQVVDRVPHDYQRINIDFAGGVAFGSDQGMFIMNGSSTQLISACGDLNNNVIMHPAIAEGTDPGERCIVTAIWDWSPIASWDSGKHWPSWQLPEEGGGLGYIGEGGGCYGVGKSQVALCMHHHNIAYSNRCGKNFTRFVPNWGASVGPPTYTSKPGSRSEPDGMIYAIMTMPAPPWDMYVDKEITCAAADYRGDLGPHTSYSCLSHTAIGIQYGWYPGVNVAVWRGDGSGHCYLCQLSGNASSWDFREAQGAQVFVLRQDEAAGADGDVDRDGDREDEEDEDGDGEDEEVMRHFYRHVQKTGWLEWGEEEHEPASGLGLAELEAGGNPKYTLLSWNLGANWTWIILPDFLQGLSSFVADPTNSSTLYGITPDCISRSHDKAETWEYCWDAPGLEGSFQGLTIKDSQTMLLLRNGDVPLRTRDGGASWHRLASVKGIENNINGAAYSWSGKTLALSGVRGQIFVFISKDDGDTWVDESGDYTAMTGGIDQWYENTLYISSLGQGISAKVFPEA